MTIKLRSSARSQTALSRPSSIGAGVGRVTRTKEDKKHMSSSREEQSKARISMRAAEMSRLAVYELSANRLLSTLCLRLASFCGIIITRKQSIKPVHHFKRRRIAWLAAVNLRDGSAPTAIFHRSPYGLPTSPRNGHGKEKKGEKRSC